MTSYLQESHLHTNIWAHKLLLIAMNIRSKTLYHDCFIHFVGMLIFSEDVVSPFSDAPQSDTNED